MIHSNFSTLLEKYFATEKTADENLVFIYIIASVHSIFLNRKHRQGI